MTEHRFYSVDHAAEALTVFQEGKRGKLVLRAGPLRQSPACQHEPDPSQV